MAEDLSDEHAWQLSQEFRLASNFSGPLNFSVGGNYLHYETEENYYVFINTLTLFAARLRPWHPAETAALGSRRYRQLTMSGMTVFNTPILTIRRGPCYACIYIDPNPINSLNNNGHNYFLSQNPYVLNSYADFGGNLLSTSPTDLKLIGGMRWTDDQKHFTDIPSEILAQG